MRCMRPIRNAILIAISAGITLTIIVPAQAIPTMDSSLFEIKFEGDVSPPTDFSLWQNAGPAMMSSDGDIFTFHADNGDAFLVSDSWPGLADDAGGWTLEVRLRVVAGGGTSDKGVAMRFGDAENSEANPQHQLFFREGKVTSNFAGTDVVATMDTTDAFHVYRVAEEGGSNNTLVWIDGVQIPHTFLNSPFGIDNMWFGAGGGGFDGTGEFDYVRWTGEGGFAPPMVAPIPGDVNNDGFVDIFDINLVSANWGTPGGPVGDANGDGNVDIFDINLISANWMPSGGTAVPEPCSVLLAGLAVGGVIPLFRGRLRRDSPTERKARCC
jgi:hypothetical protein